MAILRADFLRLWPRRKIDGVLPLPTWMPGPLFDPGENTPCPYCGTRMRLGTPNFPSREHITPQCRGGSSKGDNMVWACAACNHRKADDSLLEFLFRGGMRGGPLGASYRRTTNGPRFFELQEIIALAQIYFGVDLWAKNSRRTRLIVAWSCFQRGVDFADIAEVFMGFGHRTAGATIMQMVASLNIRTKQAWREIEGWRRFLEKHGYPLEIPFRTVDPTLLPAPKIPKPPPGPFATWRELSSLPKGGWWQP